MRFLLDTHTAIRCECHLVREGGDKKTGGGKVKREQWWKARLEEV
jgi:hypothetical protein